MGVCDLCGFDVPSLNDVVTLEKYVYFLQVPSDTIGTKSRMFGSDPPLELLGLEFHKKQDKTISRHLEPVWAENGTLLCPGDRGRLRLISSNPEGSSFPGLRLSESQIADYKNAYTLLKRVCLGAIGLKVRE